MMMVMILSICVSLVAILVWFKKILVQISERILV